jgi:hypothetical protein
MSVATMAGAGRGEHRAARGGRGDAGEQVLLDLQLLGAGLLHEVDAVDGLLQRGQGDPVE